MEGSINKFRFLIPVLLVFGVIFSFYPELIPYLLDLQSDKKVASITILIEGSLIVLALGFIISSVGYFLVNLRGWTITIFNETQSNNIRGKLTGLGELDKPISYRDIIFSEENGKRLAEFEFAEWIVANDQGKYIRDQIDKRWQMFMVNLNSTLAVVFGGIISLIFLWGERICSINLLPLIFWGTVFGIFYYNGHKAYLSVHALTRLSAENFPNRLKDKVNDGGSK